MTPDEITDFVYCSDCDTLYLNCACKYVYCGCADRKMLADAGLDPMQSPRMLRTGRASTKSYLQAAGLGLARRLTVIRPNRVTG